MTKWRPEGWDEFKISRCVARQGIPEASIEPRGCETCPTNIKECMVDVETAADALLEGLRKAGRRVDINEYGGVNYYYPYLLTIPAKGYLVFIPEEG